MFSKFIKYQGYRKFLWLIMEGTPNQIRINVG